MAGPTCSVLCPTAQRACLSVDELMELVAAVREGDSFWVQDTRQIGGSYTGEGRPFLLFWEPREGGELRSLETKIGWVPEDEIGPAAMCNDPQDHRILAEIAIWLAERQSGIVDLGGELPFLSQTVHDVSSVNALCPAAIAHLATPSALRTWLGSAEFKMGK